MRYLGVALAVAIIGMAVPACRTAGAGNDGYVPDPKVRLVVKNESISEMGIYAVSDGVSSRVGTVSGFSTKAFAIEPYLLQVTHARIDGMPIGGNDRATTGDLFVSPGQVIEFTIRQTLRTSTVSIQ
jgi:hypothetical protein